MFLSLMALMFTGYPIGLVLGGLAVAYGALGIASIFLRRVLYFCAASLVVRGKSQPSPCRC